MAAGNHSAAAPLPRAHRVLRRPVEASARVRNSRARSAPPGCTQGGFAFRGADDRPEQPGIAAGDQGKRRAARGTVPEAGAVWTCARAAVPHRFPVVRGDRLNHTHVSWIERHGAGRSCPRLVRRWHLPMLEGMRGCVVAGILILGACSADRRTYAADSPASPDTLSAPSAALSTPGEAIDAAIARIREHVATTERDS